MHNNLRFMFASGIIRLSQDRDRISGLDRKEALLSHLDIKAETTYIYNQMLVIKN